MEIITMNRGVAASAMPLPVRAVAGIPATHRAGWAPAAAAPQHKRRYADAIPASVKWGTT
ncbi:hypothetical protein V4U86_20050 [Mycobacterium sp. AMU20-3851]|uniref:hypothetical protein n=1 Tax=Mycobacterium sp. AMU20-3851 TaxID=3122055 RepID=UPI0037547504